MKSLDVSFFKLAMLVWAAAALAGCSGGSNTGSDGGSGTGGGTGTGTGGGSGGGVGGGSGDDGGMIAGTGETVSMMVGAEGGEIELTNATLTIPAGAVATTTMITVTETTMATPAGYRPFSPLYQFEPAGLKFAEPVTISIRSRATGADLPLGTLFWSQPAAEGGGWAREGGIPTGGNVVGTVEHFSYGFIADGVDYAEPPDRSCTRTRVLETREVDPSGVALFFAMDDCDGRPITGLAAGDLDSGAVEVLEDGAPISVEAVPTLLDRNGLDVFVTLLLDLSGSTMPVLDDVIAGARAFVQSISDRDLSVRIAVRVFAGQAGTTEWQAFTNDTGLVATRLGDLMSYTPEDGSSTNLNGALVDALEISEREQQAFRDRNQGGAFSAGYVIVFTDGADTAGIVATSDAEAAVQATPDEVLAVGLDQSRDYDPAVLERFAPESTIHSPDVVTLDREFRRLAARIAGQVSRTYLLGYCSPKRSGSHTTGVRLSESMESRVIGEPASFEADGFSGGCAINVFACDPSDDCGGLGCGSCLDATTICNGRNRCVSHCANANLCGGEGFTNPLGYMQTCADDEDIKACGADCRQIGTDPRHCGDCDAMCSGDTAFCSSGECVAPIPLTAPSTPTSCGSGQGVWLDRRTLHLRCVTAYPANVTPPASFGIVGASDDRRVVAVDVPTTIPDPAVDTEGGAFLFAGFVYVAGESTLRELPAAPFAVSRNGRTVLLESGQAYHVATGALTEGNGEARFLSDDGLTAILHTRSSSTTQQLVRWSVTADRGSGGEAVCSFPSSTTGECGLLSISPDGQTLLFQESESLRRTGPGGTQTFELPPYPDSVGQVHAAAGRYVLFDVTRANTALPAPAAPLGSEVLYLDFNVELALPIEQADYAAEESVSATVLSSDGSRVGYTFETGHGVGRVTEARFVEIP